MQTKALAEVADYLRTENVHVCNAVELLRAFHEGRKLDLEKLGCLRPVIVTALSGYIRQGVCDTCNRPAREVQA